VEPPNRFLLVFYRDNAADAQLTIDDVQAALIHQCRVFQSGGNSLAGFSLSVPFLFWAGLTLLGMICLALVKRESLKSRNLVFES